MLFMLGRDVPFSPFVVSVTRSPSDGGYAFESTIGRQQCLRVEFLVESGAF